MLSAVLSETVEHFAQEMVTEFYKGHTQQYQFDPVRIYTKYRSFFSLDNLKRLQQESKTSRQAAYTYALVLELYFDDIQLLVSEQKEIPSLLNTEAKKLGFANYLEVIEITRTVSIPKLTQLCTETLEMTKQEYDSLRRSLQYTEITSEDYIIKKIHDALVIKNPIPTASLAEYFKAWGIEKNIRIEYFDVLPVAFVSPKNIPSEIIVVAPKMCKNIMDIKGFLHEMGHALSLASMNPTLPSIFKRGGNYDVSEGYAFLFEFFGLYKISEEKQNIIRFYRLFSLRRQCLKTLAQIVLFSGRTNTISFEEELGILVNDTNYVLDNFTGVDLIHADILCEKLSEKIGDVFSKESQSILENLMFFGNSRLFDEMLQEIEKI